jgi:hypothetical protein
MEVKACMKAGKGKRVGVDDKGEADRRWRMRLEIDHTSA